MADYTTKTNNTPGTRCNSCHKVIDAGKKVFAPKSSGLISGFMNLGKVYCSKSCFIAKER
jgi:hypothetical protein